MTLAELVVELDALRVDYSRLGAFVRADGLLELVIAKLECVDLEGVPLDGPDLSTEEAGRLLSLSTKTVERLCRDGKISGRKTTQRGRWRISRSALQDYRNGRRSRKSSELKLWRA